VSRRDGCVRGKDTLLPDGMHILVDKSVSVKPAGAFIEHLQHEQRGMAFVHVKPADLLVAPGAHHPHPADAEDDFLAKPIP